MSLATISRKPDLTMLVFGEPEGQARPRATRRGKHIGIYSPKSRWYYAVMGMAQEHAIQNNTIPIPDPVTVALYFRMKRIKSLPKTKEIPHCKKPDIDNLAKAFLDAITPVILADDKQVVELHVSKRYALKEEQPGCICNIYKKGNP